MFVSDVREIDGEDVYDSDFGRMAITVAGDVVFAGEVVLEGALSSLTVFWSAASALFVPSALMTHVERRWMVPSSLYSAGSSQRWGPLDLRGL